MRPPPAPGRPPRGGRALRAPGVVSTVEIRDLFLTGSGCRTEHYEIAAYTSLITMADSLGEDKVVHLLKENLRQEQETLEKLETAGRRLAKNGNA